MTRRLWTPAIVSLALIRVAAAQQPASAPGTGTVTGHVLCSDTQRPARFAHVVLFAVPPETPEQPVTLNPGAADPDKVAHESRPRSEIAQQRAVNTQTGADGSFAAVNVPPGDYYVFAEAPGYVTPDLQIQAELAADAAVSSPANGPAASGAAVHLSTIPFVHVLADRSVAMDLSMQRGAVISGTLSWDDGTPIAGASVAAVAVKKLPELPRQFSLMPFSGSAATPSTTDDLGHFRIAGLEPGEYYIEATITTAQQITFSGGMRISKVIHGTPLVIYAPAAFHKIQAKSVSLTAAEDLGDQRVVIRTTGMHSVSGTVEAAGTHQKITAGTVMLTDSEDADFKRSADLDAAGNFTLRFVPNGTYGLVVSSAEDVGFIQMRQDPSSAATPVEAILRTYQPGAESVVVADGDVIAPTLGLVVDTSHNGIARPARP